MRYVICLLAVLLMPQWAQAKEVLKGPFPFEVLEIIDGDTFRARITIWLGQSVDVKVRLKGVDTPEMRGKCAAEKQLAQKAKDFAAAWLKKNPAVLTNVHYGTYAGRVLATIEKSRALARIEKSRLSASTYSENGTLGAALLSAKLAKPYRGRRAIWCS